MCYVGGTRDKRGDDARDARQGVFLIVGPSCQLNEIIKAK
jgi:hypothetical protein